MSIKNTFLDIDRIIMLIHVLYIHNSNYNYFLHGLCTKYKFSMSYQFHISLGYSFTTLYIYPINSKCIVDSSSQSAIIHIKLKKHQPTDKENIIEQSIPDIAFMRWKLMLLTTKKWKCCGIIKNHGASIFVAFVCIIPHLSIYLSMSFELLWTQVFIHCAFL